MTARRAGTTGLAAACVGAAMAAMALVAAGAAPGAAQDLAPPATPTAAAGWHGPLIPASHWVRGVLDRLDALGRLPAGDAGGDGWTRGGAAAALAGVVAPGGGARNAPSGSATDLFAYRLAGAARDRLVAEAGPLATAGAPGAAGLPVSIAPGVEWRRTEGAIDAGFDTSAAGPPVVPVARSAAAEARAVARLAAVPAPWLALEAVPAIAADGGRLRVGHAAVRLGPGVLWAGRRAVASAGGGVDADDLVLAYAGALDGGGIALRGAPRLPGVLGWLGPVSASAFAAGLAEAGETVDPWLAAVRVGVRPHERLSLRVERAALVSGGVDAARLLRTLVGAQGDDAEADNQVLAASARLRLRPGGVPVAVDGTLAVDDAAGAWRDVPATALALRLPAVPGLPRLAVDVRRTVIARSCCGNPAWYRHLALPWIAGRSLLGHPLGGHGHEWRVGGRWDALPLWASGRVEVFRRWRGEENLHAPARAGRSVGADVGFEAGGPWVDGAARLQVEAGTGWSAFALSAGFRVRL